MPKPNEYISGTRVELLATFTDINGDPIDPVTVTFKYIDPATGAIVTLVFGVDAEVIQVSTGVYKVDLDPVSEGMWVWRSEGTDTPQVAGARTFKVLQSPFVAG